MKGESRPAKGGSQSDRPDADLKLASDANPGSDESTAKKRDRADKVQLAALAALRASERRRCTQGCLPRLDEVLREMRVTEEPFRERERELADEIDRRAGELDAEREAELPVQFGERLEQLGERTDEIGAEVEDFELPPRPAGTVPDIDRSRLLFDSRRHWIDQLAAYRAHKNGAS